MLVDTDQQVATAYEVDAIPTLVLIDQRGNIVYQNVGLGYERELLDSLKDVGIDAHDSP